MSRLRGWQRNRYRGTSGFGTGKILLLLLAVVVLVIGGYLWLNEKKPETDLPPDTEIIPVPVQSPPVEKQKETDLPALPDGVHGIYISGPVAGDPYMEKLLALIDETELNTVVIDIKNDEGMLTYKADSGTALEIGACVRYISDLPALMKELKAHNIYTIARVAAFKDPMLAKKRPELALRYLDGSFVTEGGGIAWVNPCDPAVWDYLEEISLEAVKMGFDEVQFDYVRFPTGKSMDQVSYGNHVGDMSRTEIVANFLERMTASIHAQGARVSADVFGTVITNQTDAELIGQNYVRLTEIVDYVCPMVYPSHYSAGAFGLELPDQEPYQTVLSALKSSKAATSEQETMAGVRAWLQDFTATWIDGHIDYGPEELRAQIQAVYDAGYTDWLLWNAKNVYTADGLLKAD